jgi:hypothetical protein
MRSRIFNLNWEEFNWKDPEQRKMLAGAMQFFCALPNKFLPQRLAKVEEFVKRHKELQSAQLQMFTIPSDFPTYEKAIEVVEKFHLVTDYDNGYEQIFDVKDFSGTKASGFDVSDVQSGLAFKAVKPGEKLKVYQMSGEKERCYFSYYGGALGWFRGLFEDQEFWTIEDNAIEFRNKAFSMRASVFYALIEAAGDEKGCCAAVPADCSDCHADALSIANTINFMAQTILTNVAGKGYGLNPQTTQFIVLTPIQLRGRVRMALGVRNQAFGDAEKVIDYNFVQLTSMMLTNANRIYVILPKRKLKAGYRMDLTLFDDFDILSYTDTVAGWMRYGGCIGDLDQIECAEYEPLSGSCPPSP